MPRKLQSGRRALICCLLLGAQGTALAAEDGSPWVTASAGGALAVSNGAFSQVKLEQRVHWGLFDGRAGLGAALQESFGVGGFVLQLGPQLRWDFRPVERWPLYVAPVLQLGYAAVYFSGPFGLGGWAHRFDLQLAGELCIELGRSWRLSARPLALDLQFDDDGTAARFDLLLGIGRRI